MSIGKSTTVNPFEGDRLISPSHVSMGLGVTEKCLSTWRHDGKGPLFVKMANGRIMYWLSEVVKWLGNSQFNSTAEAYNQAQKLKEELQKKLDEDELAGHAKKRKVKKGGQKPNPDTDPDQPEPDV